MKTAVAVLFLGLGFLLGAFALPQSAIDHGREIYAAQKCALCHSIKGIGGKKAPLDGVGSRLKTDDLKKWIRTPKEMKSNTTMKSYPDLPDKDLNDLVNFLASLK